MQVGKPDRDGNDYIICVYLADSFDTTEVQRVLHALRALAVAPPARTLYYKTDLATLCGIYAPGVKGARLTSASIPGLKSWLYSSQSFDHRLPLAAVPRARLPAVAKRSSACSAAGIQQSSHTPHAVYRARNIPSMCAWGRAQVWQVRPMHAAAKHLTVPVSTRSCVKLAHETTVCWQHMC